MVKNEQLNGWISTVSNQFPNLSKPQATVLALWSFGLVLARCCALSAVVIFLAPFLKVKENTLRQRLREWCYDAPDKRGEKRVSLNVESCFPFLLRWIISSWQGTQLALALDATTLSDRFVVLAISVLYRGCAIPVAWTILKGNESHAWKGEWLRLLRTLKGNIPSEMTVIVLTDRGLYASWLFRGIRRLKWHPFMRLNAGGTFRPETAGYYRPLVAFAPQPNTRFSACGTAFKTKGKQLVCTLLACWEQEMDEAWFLVTDLLPASCDACWYGLRAWIEQGFRSIKRGGWQWHRTRMTEPSRASRLWLVISVATLWLLSVAGEVDEHLPESTCLDITETINQGRQKRQKWRLVSLFRRGLVRIMIALLTHQPLPKVCFMPEPWGEIQP